MEEIELRKQIKKKKPNFIRQDAHKKPGFKKKWRRPRGLHSKMRLRKKGYCRSVEPGWGSPKSVKGLGKNGLEVVRVFNLAELKGVDKEKSEVLIAGSVGVRKKVDILKEAEKLGVAVINVKDVPGFIKSVEEKAAKKKEENEKKAAEKAKKKKAREEKAKEKDKEKPSELAEKIDEEEKRKKDKEEKDKVLTKKGS